MVLEYHEQNQEPWREGFVGLEVREGFVGQQVQEDCVGRPHGLAAVRHGRGLPFAPGVCVSRDPRTPDCSLDRCCSSY